MSVVTGTHVFVHLAHGVIWTSLKETQITHAELMQHCNLHLIYMGNGVFVELTPCTEQVSYDIFGIDELVNITMDCKSTVIGMLTSDED